MVNTNVLVKIAFCLMLFPVFVFAQTVEGKWKTVDDETGETKAIVHIYKENGILKGKITDILIGEKDALCVKCKDELKDKPIKGMEIIRDFKKSGDEYEGKKLVDPETGRVVKGKLWLDPNDINKLMVRGYLSFFYRTQTWIRLN